LRRTVPILGPMIAAIGAAAGACSDDLPPVRYETDRAVIGTTFEESLCERDLAFIDERIELVERFFGDLKRRTHRIYIYDDYDDLPCPGGGFGCFHRKDGFITTLWAGVDHEIVHSVTRSVPFPSTFWDEGVAEALSAGGTRKNTYATLQAAALGSDARPDYATAGHFVRFLIETYGEEKVVRATHGADVHDVFGISVDDLVAAYETSAPYAYPAMSPCPFPEIERVDDVWIDEAFVSCDSHDGTFAEWAGVNVVRRFTLEAEGRYELTVTGGLGAVLRGCQVAPLAHRPEDFSNGDVRNEAEQEQTALGTFLESGVTHRLTLTDGVYRVALSAGTYEETPMRVEIAGVE
jgi:hypothetical protein